MSDQFEHELLIEEPPEYAGRRRPGLAGGIFSIVLAVALLGGLFLAGRAAADWLSRLGSFGADEDVAVAEVDEGATVLIDIPSGASARQIAGILFSSGVISSSGDFERAVLDRGVTNQLKAGGYELVAGADLDEIVDILIDGPNLTTFRVTIVEGRRIGELLDDFARQTDFTQQEFADALLSGAVETIYLPESIVGVQAWEGLLFPDTYEFFADATPPEMLQRLANEMERRVSELDWSDVMDRGYSIYEGIVMASMVEAEAGVDEDRPLIASVLNNRLDIEMMLQIDATVLYALGERRTGLTFDDLEFESPYNTYLIAGLPPTPIGAPGFASLAAVAQPAESEFIYYVLSDVDGSHTFTVTYEDFLAAKEKAREDGFLP